MKVCLEVLPARLSKAMYRTAEGLADAAPPEVELVDRPEDADLQVLHVIGKGSLDYLHCERYVAIQYCYKTTETGADPAAWAEFWLGADLIWSYYDLAGECPGANFLLEPLGVSPVFCESATSRGERPLGIMTSGYSAKGEAIQEVAIAAHRAGLAVLHIGPENVVAGMARPFGGEWRALSGIADKTLRQLYGRSLWVSGLRFGEGFELPVLEGLVNGARPIVFDREETRRWFNGFAEFVPECDGEELVGRLSKILSRPPRPVTPAERRSALTEFDQELISRIFWRRLLSARKRLSNVRSPERGADTLGTGQSRPLQAVPGDSGPISAGGEGEARP